MNQNHSAGYDRLAPWYERLERLRFGNGLQRARLSLLPQLGLTTSPSSPRHALFIGDGDGRLLDDFVKVYPAINVTSVDVSPVMIDMQQRRLDPVGRSRVHWICADIETVEFEASKFDVIVTVFFLDCFNHPQLAKLLPRISTWMTTNGDWYVVDFCLPQQGLRRLWARFWLAIMHLFFRWQTGLRSRYVVNILPLLDAEGLEPATTRRFHFDMIQAIVFRRTKQPL